MKFSEKWLRSLVNVDLNTEELAESHYVLESKSQ